jgi:hypothetical protein
VGDDEHVVVVLDDERSRVVCRIEITGPAADSAGPELGPEISGDFAQTLVALGDGSPAVTARPI